MIIEEIKYEMNLKKIIAESREVAQALNEFADNFERIEKKYENTQESEECKTIYNGTPFSKIHERKDERRRR